MLFLKIWIGTAGIPVSSKGGSTLDGLKRVSELGLNAFECEFVRGVNMGLEMAKEVGKLAKRSQKNTPALNYHRGWHNSCAGLIYNILPSMPATPQIKVTSPP